MYKINVRPRKIYKKCEQISYLDLGSIPNICANIPKSEKSKIWNTFATKNFG